MKLCITATGPDLDATADTAFGRAPWLLIVDTDSLAVGAVENTAADASQGAGIAAAQLIADRGAEGLLTGRVGPKAREALQVAGVEIYEGLGAGGTVRDAIRRFQQGEFSARTAAAAGAGPGAAAGQGRGRGGGGGRCRGGGGGGRGMGRGRGGRGGM